MDGLMWLETRHSCCRYNLLKGHLEYTQLSTSARHPHQRMIHPVAYLRFWSELDCQ
uniref:Uncharacterized protein n=1 Tax=Arundo donax TaxID=35708 RepID=A0A0A8XMY2_ARUDO